MTGLNHTLAGGIIALTLPAPIAIPLALLSHFILDTIPHFGRHPKFETFSRPLKLFIATEGVLSLTAMGLITLAVPSAWLVIGACCFMSVLPDLLWIFQKQVHTPEWFLRFSNWIQWGERPYGWIYEAIYTIGFTLILIGIYKSL